MKEIRQCPSCGGICRKSGCERADLDRDFSDRALNSAVYWQNRCCDLEEIIELFCMDAAHYSDDATSDEHLLHLSWLCIEELGSQLLHIGVPVDPKHPKRIAMNYATRIVSDIANRLEKI